MSRLWGSRAGSSPPVREWSSLPTKWTTRGCGPPLSLIPMHVARNAFGRQVDSREAMLEVAGLAEPFRAVFIRAPVATDVGSGVEVLARIPEGIVAVRHGRHMAFAFHPELGGGPPAAPDVFRGAQV